MLRRVGAPRAAAPRSSRRGPGGPRCARRGSWPGPCAPASAWSRPAQPTAASLAASSAAGSGTSAASAASSASTAGARASYIVLSPAPALPRSTTPPRPARSAAARSVARHRVGVAERGAHPQEERPEQRTARTADGRDERHPDLGEQRPGVGRRALVERGHGGLHAPVHVRAVVGVADRGVELGQVVPVLGDERGEGPHPLLEDRRGHALSSRSDAPSQRRRVDRSVPEREQLVIDLEQGDRRAGHVERGDVGADQRPRDRARRGR